MINRSTYLEVQKKSALLIKNTGMSFTEDELNRIDVADFGLNNIKKEGVQILTFFDTNRIAGKLLVLLPYQTEPEHWHPAIGDNPGKQEIVRAIWGELIFFIPGIDNMKSGFVPAGQDANYTVRHEILMKPGDQLIIEPGTKHWFQAGEQGAVLFSFSTTVCDVKDGFTNPGIVRTTVINED